MTVGHSIVEHLVPVLMSQDLWAERSGPLPQHPTTLPTLSCCPCT